MYNSRIKLLLLSLMAWDLWISPVTCKDLKSNPRLLHDISIFFNTYLHIFRDVLSKSLAYVMICTLCKNIDKKRSPEPHYKLFTNTGMKKSWNKCSGSTVAWSVWTQSPYKQTSPMSWCTNMTKWKPLNIQHVKQRKPVITAMQVALALLPAHYSCVQHE